MGNVNMVKLTLLSPVTYCCYKDYTPLKLPKPPTFSSLDKTHLLVIRVFYLSTNFNTEFTIKCIYFISRQNNYTTLTMHPTYLSTCAFTYFEYLLDKFLLIMESGLEVLDIELEEIERSGSWLTEHFVEAQILTDDEVEVHP